MSNKVVIVGGTSVIAEHCARIWANGSSKEIILLGRDSVKTERVAQDLRVRNPKILITPRTIDFFDSKCIRECADDIVLSGLPDIVLIAHGSLPDQIDCQQDLDLCKQTLMVNGLSPVLFAEAFATHMQKANRGSIAIIGSVAGDRGRRSNYVYGAGKSLVDKYARGMQHRFAGSNVYVTLIKPGPTQTPMTAKLQSKGVVLASPQDVAATITAGIARKADIVYAPAKWRLIMLIIIHLPRFIFNKLDI